MKKAASADFVRFGGESLTSFANTCVAFSSIDEQTDSPIERSNAPATASGGPLEPDFDGLHMSDHAEAVVRDYYDALRDGDPLAPFFLDDESTVKFGISESLFGGREVTAALEEQTETTANWSIESEHLVVDEGDGFATVADEVAMAWTDVESGERHRFDSRWSGTLVERATVAADVPDWRFAVMHVSAPHEL